MEKYSRYSQFMPVGHLPLPLIKILVFLPSEVLQWDEWVLEKETHWPKNTFLSSEKSSSKTFFVAKIFGPQHLVLITFKPHQFFFIQVDACLKNFCSRHILFFPTFPLGKKSFIHNFFFWNLFGHIYCIIFPFLHFLPLFPSPKLNYTL